MRLSAVIGFFLLAFVLAGATLLGGSTGAFLNAPAMLLVPLGVLALSLMSFGVRDTALGLWALRVLVVRVDWGKLSARQAAVLRGMIVHAYSWAGVLTLIAGAQMLRALGDASRLGAGIAAMLLVPLYAMLGAELLLRPALHRVRLTLGGAADRRSEGGGDD